MTRRLKWIGLIEGDNMSPVVKWFETKEEVDPWMSQWLRDNRDTRPQVRMTISECLFTIEG